MAGDFSIDQKRYLEGFVAGAQALRSVQGGGAAAAPSTDHEGPDKAHLEAQD
jgi:ferredoxin-nitrite reductase